MSEIICSWCDESATIALDSMDARCAACDRRWFPADLTARIIGALRERVGIHAEVFGMGGGCEAIRIFSQRADGRYLYVSDGDAARPTTRGIHAAWLDEDSDEWSDETVLHVDIESAAWDVDEAIDTIVVALTGDAFPYGCAVCLPREVAFRTPAELRAHAVGGHA